MIGHDFSQGFPGVEMIRSALNIPAPTLRRRLKREGTTFQQLKDSCRSDAARELLARADLSISAVAIQLGFTDPSTFHRSFKKWTGQYVDSSSRCIASNLIHQKRQHHQVNHYGDVFHSIARHALPMRKNNPCHRWTKGWIGSA